VIEIMILNLFDDQPFRVMEKLAATCAFLFAANVVAWVSALTAFSDRPALLGMAFLAYMLGLGMRSMPTTSPPSIMSSES